jgi:flagellar protein FliO/FliZ
MIVFSGRGKLKLAKLARLIAIGVLFFILVKSPLYSQSINPDESTLFFDAPPAATAAAEGAGEAGGGAAGGGSSLWPVIRTALVLILVAAAVYGIVYFLKKANKGRLLQNPHIHILASSQLSPSRSLYAVSIGTQAWLIGAGEGGISLISELQDQDEINTMKLEETRGEVEAGRAPRLIDFKALLGRFAGASEKSDVNNITRNTERLRGL